MATLPQALAQGRASVPVYLGSAPVAYLKDLSSGAVLYSRDADRRFAPASMTKMMTAYVAFDMIERGETTLDTVLTVRPATWKAWSGRQAGSTMFLRAGEKIKVRDLLRGIITVSGNDASVVLAEGLAGDVPAFVERMNRTAKRIGMANSRFGTANGWPDQGRTMVTARDMALLGERTVRDHPTLFREFYGHAELAWGKAPGGATIVQPNRNPILGVVAGADGFKTGHTDEAGYNFTGSAAREGRRLVMVVGRLPSAQARKREAIALMEWGFAQWQSRPVVAGDAVVGSAPVQGGTETSVPLKTRQPVAVTTPVGTSPAVKVRIAYHGPVAAPVRAGDVIGELVVTPSGMAPQRTPLIAAQSVAAGNAMDRVRDGLARMTGR